ncbi:YncE family protein [Actinoplanes sp. NBRC 103695]|uniref:YncE family protein n=1 Tax=Actinoplanes sp. NBRC 103695 TaxID=3032202 RepID=UPI0025561D21|nr:YncE family protein [Actinoplanes sp. NBRC 103695]
MSERSGLPPQVLTGIDSPIRDARLRGVGELARLTIGTDLAMAAAARRALSHMTGDESRVVAAAAAGMLERTAIRLNPESVDFGQVPTVATELAANIEVHGPPLAAVGTVTASGPGLSASLDDGRLRITWQPRTEWLDGTVTVHGPCGWADVRVTGRVAIPKPFSHLDLEELAAADIDPNAARVTVLVAPQRTRRAGAGALAAVLVALVLLGGAGVAFALTNGEQTPAPLAAPSLDALPSPAPSVTTKSATVPKVQLAQPQRVSSLGRPKALRAIKVGEEPEGVAVAPDGRTIYVANQGERKLSIVDARGGRVTGVKLRNTPRFVAVSRNSRLVFVSMYEEDKSGSGVAVVDAGRRTVIRYLATGQQPYTLAVGPDGRLWVPIHGKGRLEVYDEDGRNRKQSFDVPPNPHAIAFSAPRKRAFTASHESNAVAVVDTATGKVVRSIPVSKAPHSVAVSPDGSTVLAAGYEADSADLISARTLRRTGPLKVGRDPQCVAFSRDGRHAYIVNEGDGTVSVLDARTVKITATIKVGRSPRTIATSPDGRLAYVTNGDDNTITVLRVGA